ncbi:MAG: FtsH protease activity modulator HflK [Desulfobulbaceae bacterium]|nr:MAG: FtsH protease activity modulator HflK [Desulfobulbaceae bacterium]
MNDQGDKSSKNNPNTDGPQQSVENTSTQNTLPVLAELRTRGFAFWKTLQEAAHFVTSIFQTESGDRGSVKSDIRRAFANLSLRKTLFGSVLLSVLLYVLSGVYVVNPGEVAVVRLFGKEVNQGISEGMHYRLPWPFQEVDIVNVATVRREGIGILLPEHESIHSSPEVIQFLSGDDNIVDIQAVVQYRIKDASDYLYSVNYRDCQLINETIRTSITEIGGGMRVDDILTIGKERLQELIRDKAQGLLDKYRSGLELVGINLNKVYPPEEVAEAFRDVSNANQDREKTVNDAWGYQNTVVPQARGDAAKILQEAEAYKISVINKASGEAGRFSQMLVEYEQDLQKASSDVTLNRLYLESMEKIMPKVKKYIVDPDGGKFNLRLLQKELSSQSDQTVLKEREEG